MAAGFSRRPRMRTVREEFSRTANKEAGRMGRKRFMGAVSEGKGTFGKSFFHFGLTAGEELGKVGREGGA